MTKRTEDVLLEQTAPGWPPSHYNRSRGAAVDPSYTLKEVGAQLYTASYVCVYLPPAATPSKFRMTFKCERRLSHKHLSLRGLWGRSAK